MLYKENQDLKTEMQILRNYYDREKLIRQNKKAMRNFPSRAHNRKMRYQDLMKAAAMKKQMMKKNIMFIQKRKNKEKNIMMTLMATMMTLMTILMIMRMTKSFQKMIMIIMIMMKNAIKIKITKK